VLVGPGELNFQARVMGLSLIRLPGILRKMKHERLQEVSPAEAVFLHHPLPCR